MMKIVTAVSLFCALCEIAQGQGTAFTYQGSLNDGGSLANGNYDMEFYLRDALTAGNPVGATNTVAPVAASNGLFTVVLDFGNQFNGNARWLEIGVRTNGSVAPYSVLAPRQALTPTPYAIMAGGASNLLGVVAPSQVSAGTAAINISGTAASFTGSLSGDVTGTQSATVVSKVGGVTAANVATGANAANAATTANNANTIVKRDGSGNFSAGSLTLAGNLNLPATTATAGIVYSAGSTLIHSSGPFNVFLGAAAGNLATAGWYNTGVGVQSLSSNSVGSGNTATGYRALNSNTNGANNTADGDYALANNLSGSANTAIGNLSLVSNTGGGNNTACGNQSLSGNLGGNNNTACGGSALGQITNGSYNSAFGAFALGEGTNGNYNTAAGYATLLYNAGDGNTASGYQVLYYNTTGATNTATGLETLLYNTTGSDNTATGSQSMYNNTTGSYNTAEGFEALYSNANGTENTASGEFALYSNTSGTQNTAVGGNALFNNTSATGNTSLGYQSLFFNTNGSYNTACGYQSLASNTYGGFNAALGFQAGFAITGSNNIDIGNTGQASDNGIIRIGTSGVQSNTYLVGNVQMAGDVTLTGGAAYHNLSLSGGNAIGYLYGSYPALGDGINLGYNWYADASGTGHVFNTGGGTSRISVGYSSIVLAVGGIDTAPTTTMLQITTGGVCANGAIANCSDRNVKQDFGSISPSQILDKVMGLPVSQWSYTNTPAVRHIGPMAQDFYSAFSVGADDKHITTIDEGGVALAAIQGLNEKVEGRSQKAEGQIEELRAENTKLQSQVVDLQSKLDGLQEIVARLADKSGRGLAANSQ